MKELAHYIIIRFYNADWGYYPKGTITDVEFLEKAKNMLVSNCFASLENQTNKNFEVIILMNNDLEDEHPIFNSLNSIKSSFIVHVIKAKDLGKTLIHDDVKYFITSRTDLDDFAKSTAVEEIQNYAKGLNNIPYAVYGFGNGIAIVDKDITTAQEYLPSYLDKGPMSIMESLIVNTTIAKNITNIYNLGDHSRVKFALEKLYEKDNIPFIQKSYFVNTERLSYLYIKTGSNISLLMGLNKKWGDDRYKVVKDKDWYKNNFGLVIQ